MAQLLVQPLAEPLVQKGMVALPCSDGVAFRVWAPHAAQVSVVGTFNDWDASAHPMQSEPRGYWSAFVERARIGDPYSYEMSTDWGVHQQAPRRSAQPVGTVHVITSREDDRGLVRTLQR